VNPELKFGCIREILSIPGFRSFQHTKTTRKKLKNKAHYFDKIGFFSLNQGKLSYE